MQLQGTLRCRVNGARNGRTLVYVAILQCQSGGETAQEAISGTCHAVRSGTGMGVGMRLTGDVDNLGGILRSPKGIYPFASHFAGCDTCSENTTPNDDAASTQGAHADIKKAACSRLNGITRDRRCYREKAKRLSGVGAVDVSPRDGKLWDAGTLAR